MNLFSKIFLSTVLVLSLPGIPIVLAGYFIINEIIYDLHKSNFINEISHIQRYINNAQATLEETGVQDIEFYINDSKNQILNQVNEYRYGKTGHIDIVNHDNHLLTHKHYNKDELLNVSFIKNIFKSDETEGNMEYTLKGKNYFSVFKKSLTWNWVIIFEIEKNEIFQQRNNYIKFSSVAIIITFFIMIIVAYFLAKSNVTRMNSVLDYLKNIEHGHLDTNSPRISQKYKIGIIQNGIKSMVQRMIQANSKLKYEIKQRKTAEIAMLKAKENAEEANKFIMGSIEYAEVIQRSLLPNMEQVTTYLPNNFFLWMPRDVVSGDMVYAEQVKNGFIIAVIDCTGHGVPGAFMTMIVSTNLRRIIREQTSHSPAEILQQLSFLVKTSLQQDTEYAKSDDGLDIAICLVQDNTLTFAGARLPLYYINNGELTIVKGDKQSLGYKKSDIKFKFANHTIKLESGMVCYLSTDGFLDQLGGKKRFQFGRKRFKNLLLENYQRSFSEQSQIILQAFNDHKDDNDRQDDVTVVGFLISEK